MLLSTWHRFQSASLLSRTVLAVLAGSVGTAAFLGVATLALTSITEAVAGEPSDAPDAEVAAGEEVVVVTDAKGAGSPDVAAGTKRSGLTSAPRSGTQSRNSSPGESAGRSPTEPEGEDP